MLIQESWVYVNQARRLASVPPDTLTTANGQCRLNYAGCGAPVVRCWAARSTSVYTTPARPPPQPASVTASHSTIRGQIVVHYQFSWIPDI
jgi:hypothetical protein